MRKVLGVLLFLAAASIIRADEFVVFSAQTADCDPCINTGDGFGGIYDLTGFTKTQVQCSSAAGSSAVCSLYTRSTVNDPWGLVFAVTNPSATQLFYVGPGAGQIKLVVSSYVSGSLKGTIKRTK